MEIYKINKDDKNSLKSLILDYFQSNKETSILNHSFWADKLSLFSKEELGFDVDEFIDKKNRLNSFKNPISDPTKIKVDTIGTSIDYNMLDSTKINKNTVPRYLPVEDQQSFGTINRPSTSRYFYNLADIIIGGEADSLSQDSIEPEDYELLDLNNGEGSVVLDLANRHVVSVPEWMQLNQIDEIWDIIEEDEELRSLVIKVFQKTNEIIRREYFKVFHNYEFNYTYKPIFEEKHEYIDIISTLKENEGFTGVVTNLSLTIKHKKFSYGGIKYYYSKTD